VKKILICGYFGFGNAGDELILENVSFGIKNEIPDADFTAMYKKPPAINYVPQLRLMDRWNPFSVIKQLLNTNLVICAGGLFQDLTGSLSLWYYLAIIFLAKMFGKKVLLFGVDFTPINGKLNKWFLKKTLLFVDKICARSEGSMKFLEELGVERNVILTADSVFSQAYLGSGIPKPDTNKLKKVGIILKFNGKNENEYLSIISDMCASLRNNLNADIVFIPFHLERDLEISLKAASRFKFGVSIERWQKPQDLFEIINSVDFLLSQRFHALIAGVMLKVPMLGISDDKKLEFFFNELGQKHLILNKIEVNKIAGIVKAVWDTRNAFKNSLIKKLPVLKSRSFLNIKQAINLLS